MRPFALQGDSVYLDLPVHADAERIFEYCQDPIFKRYLTTPWPYTRLHAHGFVDEYVAAGWRTGSELSWAIRDARGGPLLGVIALRMLGGGTAEVGFWLGGPHRGSGRMTASVVAVVDWALGAGGVQKLLWECVLGNVASMAVARKTGFTFTGTAPSRAPYRGGEHVESWHGELCPTDSRAVKPGWPEPPAASA
jgi:RimJ/RimL family protein N-acetyltransferase